MKIRTQGYHADTLIMLADGSEKSIREIVETQDVGPILAYNDYTQLFEVQNILDWQVVGVVKRWVVITFELVFEKANSNTIHAVRKELIVGGEHFLYNEMLDEYDVANDLSLSDTLLSPLSDDVAELLKTESNVKVGRVAIVKLEYLDETNLTTLPTQMDGEVMLTAETTVKGSYSYNILVDDSLPFVGNEIICHPVPPLD